MSNPALKQQTKTVLIVEDSKTQSLFLSNLLEIEGYSTAIAESGVEAKAIAGTQSFDFILLDLGLPDIDGLDLCRHFKQTTASLVVIVTGRSEPMDRIIGLGAGGDDYLAKPVEPLELLLRLKALSRLVGDLDSYQEITFSDLRLDMAARNAFRHETQLELTKIEFDLLASLVVASGSAVEKEELAEAAWGSSEWLGDGHALAVHMANLKKKIVEHGPQLVVAIRGVGYRLEQ